MPVWRKCLGEPAVAAGADREVLLLEVPLDTPGLALRSFATVDDGRALDAVFSQVVVGPAAVLAGPGSGFGAGGIGHGVGCFHNFQTLRHTHWTFGGMPITRHHHARQRRFLGPECFNCVGHGTCGLASAQYQSATLGHSRQKSCVG